MKKIFAFVLFASLAVSVSFAQAASQFTAGAQVVGLSGSAGAQAVSDAGFRFAVTDRLELGTDNYIGASYHSHFGTASYSLPLSKLLKKTNLNDQNFRFGVKAGAGVVYPSTGNQTISGLFGGWMQYSPAGNGKFGLEAGVDYMTADKSHVAVRFGPVLTF